MIRLQPTVSIGLEAQSIYLTPCMICYANEDEKTPHYGCSVDLALDDDLDNINTITNAFCDRES